MGQLGSHKTDFYKIRYFSIIRKCVEKTKRSLKSNKNNMNTYTFTVSR